MSPFKIDLILSATLIVVAIYTIPSKILAKVGEVLIKLNDKVLAFNDTLKDRIPLLKRALEADLAIQLEERKESVRRKRANAQE